MINSKNIKYKLTILCLIKCFQIFTNPQFCNLFSPYEWIFDQARYSIYKAENDFGLTCSVRGEFSLNSDGYMSNDENFLIDQSNKFRHIVNPTSLFSPNENAFASYLGNDINEDAGMLVQSYNMYAGATTETFIKYSGDLSLNSINLSNVND